MSLADDIRTGAKMSDPAHGYYTNHPHRDSKHEFSACALGCAAIARGSGRKDEADIIADLKHWYPELMLVQVEHPVRALTTQLWGTIMDLNDSYRWPRETIASWLDTLTLDLTPVAVQTAVSV